MKEYKVIEDSFEKYNNSEYFEEDNEINYYDAADENVAIVDSVKQYLEEIGRIPLLTEEQEFEMATKICNLRNKLISKGIFDEDKVSNELLKKKITEYGFDVDNDLKKTVIDILYSIENSYFDKPELKELLKDIELYLEYENITNKFIEANLRLSVSVAKKYNKSIVPFLELIQEGNIGLKKAVDKFDVTKGYKFSTYATWWIRQAMSRYIADTSRTIRVPVHYHETILKISRLQNDLEIEMGKIPTDQEVIDAYNKLNNSNNTELTLKQLEKIKIVSQGLVSLQTPVGEDEDSMLSDFIESKEQTVEEVVMQNMQKDTLIGMLAPLRPLEKIVVLLRFGLQLNDYITKDEFVMALATKDIYTIEQIESMYKKLCAAQGILTLETVGKILNITRERVRQIEAKALRRLRLPSNNAKIKSLLRG